MANLAYIQVCRTCNQECRFCSNPSLDKTIPFRRAKKLVDQYVRWKYAGVIFSGGEPTLYPHLEALIRYASSKKIPARIITNGQKTAELSYFEGLAQAGLAHIGLSVYSHKPKIQNFLTKNDSSWDNIVRTLDHARRLRMTVDICTVINAYNADHLCALVKWLTQNYPFLRHFIWNNLDPSMNRATKNPDTIPCLSDFEVQLSLAMRFLEGTGRTFRAERVPLCYMAEFAHASTEARKIVKKEERTVYFLDKKGLKFQKGWAYGKKDFCRLCSFCAICPGLYMMDAYFSSQELFPVFLPEGPVIERILQNP